jgi:hypothetical protein
MFSISPSIENLNLFGITQERGTKMGGSSNDDRSDSMNPNNDAYDDSMDNHSDQLNPNNDEYQGDDED